MEKNEDRDIDLKDSETEKEIKKEQVKNDEEAEVNDNKSEPKNEVNIDGTNKEDELKNDAGLEQSVDGGFLKDFSEKTQEISEDSKDTEQEGFENSVKLAQKKIEEDAKAEEEKEEYAKKEEEKGVDVPLSPTYSYSQQQKEEPEIKIRKKRTIGVAATVILALVFGVGGGIVSGVIVSQTSQKSQEQQYAMYAAQQQEGEKTTVSNQGVQDLSSVSDIVTEVMPSITSVSATIESVYQWGMNSQPYEAQSEASGIIYSIADDEVLIVTNYHVIEDSSKISIGWFDGTSSDAEVVGYSEAKDIALLKVEKENIEETTQSNLKAIAFGDSDTAEVGEGTIAIGNALGYGQTVTTGVVSATNRDITLSDGSVFTMIQTSAAINAGNSGGALLNSNGELIGINSAKYTDTGVEGIGFAIPSNTVLEVIGAIQDGTISDYDGEEEDGARLGIVGYDVTDEMKEMYDMPTGVCIQSIEEDSVALSAGFETGDIIVSLNGVRISTISQLKSIIEGLSHGDSVSIGIQRPNGDSYENMTFDVTF